jgi:hypothetical protein
VLAEVELGECLANAADPRLDHRILLHILKKEVQLGKIVTEIGQNTPNTANKVKFACLSAVTPCFDDAAAHVIVAVAERERLLEGAFARRACELGGRGGELCKRIVTGLQLTYDDRVVTVL